jgi:hypothetical protein
MNIYYDPEKFGLTIVGEYDIGGGYEFDKTVLFFRGADGVYLYGQDSGCSCPSPFESKGIGDLTVLSYGTAGVAEFQAVLTQQDQNVYRYGKPWISLAVDAVVLLERYAERVS